MNIAEITMFLERINYASLYFQIGGAWRKFGPGEETWTTSLASLTDEAHEAISQRLGQSVLYKALTTVGNDDAAEQHMLNAQFMEE